MDRKEHYPQAKKGSDEMQIPRQIQDAVNNAIHASDIDGNQYPISLAWEAVKAALLEKEKMDRLILDNTIAELEAILGE